MSGTALGTGTGSHGIVVPYSGGGTMNGLVGEINGWFHAPFTTPLDPVDVFLIVGIIIVSIIVWNLILYHVRIAAETI